MRHNFDLPNAGQVQSVLREHGASLMQTETNYTVKMCEAAWNGNLDVIRVLAENKVDVGMSDYDGRCVLCAHICLCVCINHYAVIFFDKIYFGEFFWPRIPPIQLARGACALKCCIAARPCMVHISLAFLDSMTALYIRSMACSTENMIRWRLLSFPALISKYDSVRSPTSQQDTNTSSSLCREYFCNRIFAQAAISHCQCCGSFRWYAFG